MQAASRCCRPAGLQPRCLQLDAVGLEPVVAQQLHHRADAFDRSQGDDHAARRGQGGHGLDRLKPSPADEDRVGGTQSLQGARRRPEDHLDPDRVLNTVAAQSVALLGVSLHRDHVGPEPRALDRHRAAAGADVPHRLADPGSQAGQRDGANFGLGDHGLAVLEGALGQRPAIRHRVVTRAPALPVGDRVGYGSTAGQRTGSSGG